MGSLYFSIFFSLCKEGVLFPLSFQKKGKKCLPVIAGYVLVHFRNVRFFFGGGGRVEWLRLASAIPKRRSCFKDDNTTDWFLRCTIINDTRGTSNHMKHVYNTSIKVDVQFHLSKSITSLWPSLSPLALLT